MWIWKHLNETYQISKSSTKHLKAISSDVYKSHGIRCNDLTRTKSFVFLRIQKWLSYHICQEQCASARCYLASFWNRKRACQNLYTAITFTNVMSDVLCMLCYGTNKVMCISTRCNVRNQLLYFQGQEFADQYLLEYQREKEGPWFRFHNRRGQEVMSLLPTFTFMQNVAH